jgi:hypothetical protein
MSWSGLFIAAHHSTEPGFKRKWVIPFPKSALGGALLA